MEYLRKAKWLPYIPCMYLGATLAYFKKAMFWGIEVEGFAKIFNFEDEVWTYG